MADITLYHNPRCGKSRAAKKELDARGLAYQEIHYLETPSTEYELRDLLNKLGCSAREVIRKKEAPYKELGLKDKTKSEEELIRAIVAHPILLERPIVVRGARAVIAREPGKLEELLR